MSQRPPVLMWIPPPLLYVATFAVGLWIQHAVLTEFAFPSAVRLFGFLLIAAGAVLGPGNALLFLMRRTTLIPHGRPSRLVVDKAYRFTRNPMYLGMSVLYAGVALRLDGLLPLLLLPVPVLMMDRVVIPYEEAQLRRTHAEEYGQYCSRVRRWL